MWDVFHSALELGAAHRQAFLAEECTGNPELRRRVERLLGTHSQSGGVLDRPVEPGPVASGSESLSTDYHIDTGERPRFKGELSPGTLLSDRFEIVRLLGKGGMGVVYEASDRDLESPVAIKVLRADIANEETLTRFRREIHLARQVTHPNVCRLYDLFHSDNELSFLSMELLPGETLAERLKQEGPMSAVEAEPIVKQIASALSAAHRIGIVHRDLKSANIMLVPDGERIRAVVTDFGLATTARPDEESLLHLTRTGQVLGTPAFMAPEQLEGGKITPATDIYSLGVVMYELLTGKLPFEGTTPYSLAAQRLHDEAPSPRSHLPGLDRKWERVILRCLERQPQDRFESVEELITTLETDAVALPHSRRRRRHKRIAWAAGFLLFVLSIWVVGPRLLELLQPTQQAELAEERITTTSQRARELYTEADELMRMGKDSVAEELLQEAITKDPDFASAYVQLAWAIRNQERAKEEFLAEAQRAVDLADTVTETERLFIMASDYGMRQEFEKAASNYEALLRLQPDHYWALILLSDDLWRLGRLEETIPYWVEAANLHPTDFRNQYWAAWYLAAIGGRLDEAEPYVRRATDLVNLDQNRYRTKWTVWLWMFPVHRAWVVGDPTAGLAELERLGRRASEVSGQFGNELAWSVGVNFEYFGQSRRGEEIYHNLSGIQGVQGFFDREHHLRSVELERRVPEEWIEVFAGGNWDASVFDTARLVRAGMLSEVRDLLASLEKPSETNAEWTAIHSWAQGELALAEGRIAEAIPLLQDGAGGLRSFRLASVFFLACEALARALDATGKTEAALGVLEDASDQKPRAFLGKAYGWMDMRLQLAQLLRKSGREREAREVEDDLRSLLRYADPDFRFVQQLERLEQSNPR